MQTHIRSAAIGLISSLALAGALTLQAQEYTRGVGMYPGAAAENFSPAMRIDTKNYRNLALHRAAYQSSSYDYNCTAQLITDGIKETRLPSWIVMTTSSDGVVKRNERGWVLDRNPMTRKNLEGPNAWLQFELAGESEIPEVDSIVLTGNVLVDSLPPTHWEISVNGSNDGTTWVQAGIVSGDGMPGDSLTGWWRRISPPNLRSFNYPLRLDSAMHCKYYRLNVSSPNAKHWAVGEIGMFSRGKHAAIGGPFSFTSAWMSAGAQEEWVYVDLGAECTFDRIVLSWIRGAAAGSIQTSNDALKWSDIATLPNDRNRNQADDIKLDAPTEGRYVRVLMKEPAASEGYILSEMEVFGTGGPVPVAHAQAPAGKEGRTELAGGGWKVQRESLVKSDGEGLSKPGFNDEDWIVATVTGNRAGELSERGSPPRSEFFRQSINDLGLLLLFQFLVPR